VELKAHFSDIHKVILAHLGQARSDIVAAIAWFTDRDIFEVLCKKARSGVKVSVALLEHDINQGPGGLNFHRLSAVGSQVSFLPALPHTFCVIDGSTVITGSYHWSPKARSEDANVTVVAGSASSRAGTWPRSTGSSPAPATRSRPATSTRSSSRDTPTRNACVSSSSHWSFALNRSARRKPNSNAAWSPSTGATMMRWVH
jgi:hypothetical protein